MMDNCSMIQLVNQLFIYKNSEAYMIQQSSKLQKNIILMELTLIQGKIIRILIINIQRTQIIFIKFKESCYQSDFIILNLSTCQLNCLTCLIGGTGLECLQCQNDYILIKGDQINRKSYFTLNKRIFSTLIEFVSLQIIQLIKISAKSVLLSTVYYVLDTKVTIKILVLYNLNMQQLKIIWKISNVHFTKIITFLILQLTFAQFKNLNQKVVNVYLSVLDNQERSTLSINDDFTIAPGIIYCQNYMLIMFIKYQVSYLKWKSRIQSFVLQFISTLNIDAYQKQIFPQEIENQYCYSDCLVCGQVSYNFSEYVAQITSNNQLRLRMLKIMRIVHSFVKFVFFAKKKKLNILITEENLLFTKKLLNLILNPAIYFDPYNQVTRYCLN
ncbi:unnamed protein product [Paramecium sonneborni]|uniref:Uncharacterized protein n=1 Tax=Paramecium sonneborni TaxID=65129 RepID=A0A8S1Q1F1_9CILI|nr:unnamed protein product [Paramecium sonneborni]